MSFDLGIENGRLVTPGGQRDANVYVRSGRIAAVSAEPLAADSVVDASGLLVMPGMVDTHVHLMDPADTTREDFPSGTAAAARSGVTTIIEHTHGDPVRTPKDLERKRAYLQDRSRVDYGLAAHAWPDHLDEVVPLWEAGVAFFKTFTCTTHGVPGFDAGALRELFLRVAAVDAVCLVHAEDESITLRQEAALRRSGRTDGRILPEWRHRDAEMVALSTVAELSRLTQARVVIAHLSSPASLEVLSRVAAPQVLGETCPQYLTLLEEEVESQGAFRKFTPPARAADSASLDAMWERVADGRVHHISTDHAPSTAEQKRAGSIWDVHFGLPGLDTTMAILLEGVARGRITYERLVECYSEAPARAYGLYPQKGSLEVGSDADFVLVNPGIVWTITDEALLSRAGWSPFVGRTIHGRPVATYLRGRQIAGEGPIAEPGYGRFVSGAGGRA